VLDNYKTVLLKSIRQSRVTEVLEVTDFATLSRVTEALDEYTFRPGRVKISVSTVLAAIFPSCRHFPLNLLPIFKVFGFKSHKYRATEQVQRDKKKKKKNLHHSKIC
jgi:hypothetical protein